MYKVYKFMARFTENSRTCSTLCAARIIVTMICVNASETGALGSFHSATV